MGSLARCYRMSRLNELELGELLARLDADGGEVPDRVVESHISPLSPPRESPALLRRDSLISWPDRQHGIGMGG